MAESLVCPYLPMPTEPLTARCLEPWGADRGAGFYEQALQYAHSLWLQGFPARAILLLNRAMGCDLTGEEAVLKSWPMPYHAMAWILRHHAGEGFIGNPRRHWQHLATRMVEPRKELRSWRAWACWYLARVYMPDLLADEEQVRAEGLVEPTKSEIEVALGRWGLAGEMHEWRAAGGDQPL